MKRILTAAVAIALLVGTASASTVVLKNGAKIPGSVVAVSAGQVTLAVSKTGRVTIPLDQLSPPAAFALKRERIDPGSLTAHEQLGDWAVARGLDRDAANEYRAAIRLAGTDAVPELRSKLDRAESGWAVSALENAHSLIREGKLATARDRLEEIRDELPGQPEAARAARLLAGVRQSIAAELANRPDATAPVPVASEGPDVSLARRLLDEGDRLHERANESWEHPDRQERVMKGALAVYERSADVLHNAVENAASAADSRSLSDLTKTVHQRLVAGWADLGRIDLYHGDLSAAARALDRTLSLDPADSAALGLRRELVRTRLAMMGGERYLDGGFLGYRFLSRLAARRAWRFSDERFRGMRLGPRITPPLARP
jgi:tetratricopeptide (TPR) repeat protein